MLSILISTYNYDCHKLVADLRKQAEASGVAYEIIVSDDCSTDKNSVQANSIINEWKNCTYHVHATNRGPAANRNWLISMAKYDWLIFIDSDAEVRDEMFIKRYMDSTEIADVVVGGLRHCDTCPSDKVTLRYKYENQADKHRSAAERQQNPYDKFTAFNVMMRRTLISEIGFDKECKEYGYEDALLGVELKKRGVKIAHIENPLTHLGLDTNERFLEKSETALRTLLSLNGKMEGNSHVENMANKLKRMRLAWMVKLLHRTLSGMMKRNLLSKNPSLFVFAIYKLGYYLTIEKTKE